jgi:signal transduction histidine kinase/ActR/RegA family two-component response regulator
MSSSVPVPPASGPEADAAEVPQPRSPLRAVGVTTLAVLTVAFGVFVASWSDGFLRLDIIVLATTLREVRSRATRLTAVAVAALATVALNGFSPVAVAEAAVLVTVASAFVWALRCWDVALDAVPGRRFVEAFARLALVVVLAAVAYALVDTLARTGGSLANDIVTVLLPVASAAAITAAVAGRSLLEGGAGIRSTKLAGPFVAVAVSFIAVQSVLVLWDNQERTTLQDAATTTSAAFQRIVAAALQSFGARAAVPSRTPVVDQATFDRSVRAYLYGNPAVSSVALVQDDHGTFRVTFVNGHAGADTTLAALMGGATADAAQLTSAAQTTSQIMVAIRDFPTAYSGMQPNVVWASPWVTTSNATGTQLLTTAVSLPAMFDGAAAALGTQRRDAVHLELVMEGTAGSQARIMSALGAEPQGPGASTELLLGDVPFQVVATGTDDFGTPLLVRGLVLGALLALGLVAAALMLQAANARYRARHLIEERESLLAATIDAAPGTVLLVDDRQRVLMCNGSDEVKRSRVGRPVTEALPFPLHGPDGDTVARLVAGGEAGTIEYVDTVSSAHPVIYFVAVNPVKRDTSGPAAAVVQVEDVTEDRARTVAAAQSERLRSLGTMAGGLAHDFNNLLFIISGYLQMLHDDDSVSEDENLSRYVERASDAAERGAEIASSLLSVARSQPLEATAIEVGSFLRRMWPLVDQAVGAGRFAELVVGEGPLDVLVDSGQLSGSLLNLVINARDAMEPGGTVTVGVSRQHVDDPLIDLAAADYVLLTIADDGIGMTPEVVQRAFEPYFSTKGVGHGTGIGLAAVYSFSQQSGGLARIRSEREVGTTVTLYLPAVFPVSAYEPEVVTYDSAPARRVLVVDDETALAGLIAGWLTEQGAEVRVADNPALARRVAEEFRPDLLLTDVRLGDPSGVDGPELAEEVVATVPDVRIVFMTGFSDRMDELVERGARTLAKPFTREALVSVVFPVERAGAEQRRGHAGA